MDKIKSALFSEKGMRIVNVLFFCVKKTPSKAGRSIYFALIAFACVMLALNLFFLLKLLR